MITLLRDQMKDIISKPNSSAFKYFLQNVFSI